MVMVSRDRDKQWENYERRRRIEEAKQRARTILRSEEGDRYRELTYQELLKDGFEEGEAQEVIRRMRA